MTHTKFEEALEKEAELYGEQAKQYPKLYDRSDFYAGGNAAKGFYLPLLREAMAALEWYADEENHGAGDFVWKKSSVSKDFGSKAEQTLASIRTQLGEP